MNCVDGQKFFGKLVENFIQRRIVKVLEIQQQTFAQKVVEKIFLRGAMKSLRHEQMRLQTVEQTADEIFQQTLPRRFVALPKNFRVAFNRIVELIRFRKIKRAVLQLHERTCNRPVPVKFHVRLLKKIHDVISPCVKNFDCLI